MHTHTQDSDCQSPPIKRTKLSYGSLSSPTPPTRPDDLTSTDESGSLCPTVQSPVRLEPQGPGKCEFLTRLPYGSVPEEEEPVEHYSKSPSPPTRPCDLTSTDESGSLCPTVESPVRLEKGEG